VAQQAGDLIPRLEVFCLLGTHTQLQMDRQGHRSQFAVSIQGWQVQLGAAGSTQARAYLGCWQCALMSNSNTVLSSAAARMQARP
jgi:hypothetical protein